MVSIAAAELARLLRPELDTQAGFARKIGISRQLLEKYLSGASRPPLETLIKIEEATGIPVRDWAAQEEA